MRARACMYVRTSACLYMRVRVCVQKMNSRHEEAGVGVGGRKH